MRLKAAVAPPSEPSRVAIATFAILLTLRVLSCFSLGEETADVRTLKILLRAVSLGGCIAILIGRQSVVGGRPPGAVIRHPGVLAGYAGFLAWTALSIAYSSNAGASMLQLGMYLESLVFAFAFYRSLLALRLEPALPEMVFSSAAVVAAVMLLGAWIQPDRFYRLTHGGEVARLGGLMMNPNQLGLLMVIGLAQGWVGRQHSGGLIAAGASMSMLGVLILSSSRSSLVALAVVGLYLLCSERSGARRGRLAIGAAAGLLAGYGILAGIIAKPSGSDELATLTGRLPFWQDLLAVAFAQEPLLGYGFQCIWREEFFYSADAYGGTMAHNTFLQTLLGLGLVGLFLVGLQLIATCRAAFLLGDGARRRSALAILLPLLVNSLTEFGIFGHMNFGVLFYQIVMCVVALAPAPCRPGPRTFVWRRKLHGTA